MWVCLLLQSGFQPVDFLTEQHSVQLDNKQLEG